MTEAPISLTLDQIKQQFPSQRETFSRGAYKGTEVTADVSRNEQGKIVYVVPGSIKFVKEQLQPPEAGQIDPTPDEFPIRRFPPATFDCAIPPLYPDARSSKIFKSSA